MDLTKPLTASVTEAADRVRSADPDTARLDTSASAASIVNTRLSEGLDPMQLGERQFTNGTTLPVYRSEGYQQFVFDETGKPVYGVAIVVRHTPTRIR